MDKFNRDDVQLLEQQSSFKGFFQLKTLRLRHRLFDGGWSDDIAREVFVRGDAVAVLLYDPLQDTVALVEQFRVGVLGSERAKQQGDSPWLLELVAGMIEPGETAQAVAERETLEETAVEVLAIEQIAGFYASPGGCDEYLYLFAAKVDLSNAGGIHGLASEHEDIRVHVLPVSEFMAMLQRHEINSAFTLIAAQWLQLNHQRLQQQWAS
jgi:ADP-ribose pyrophosphatase